MANADEYAKSKTTTKNNNTKQQTMIKCYQINLQHSRTATDNLMELIDKGKIDVVFIQEPYTAHNKVVGVTKRYRTFTSSVGRCRTATVVTNNQIDALLIQKATDKDRVVVELILGKIKFYTANLYLDITEKLDDDINSINDILQIAKTSGILITIDSNSRSRIWFDKITNGRGKKLEEFLISK